MYINGGNPDGSNISFDIGASYLLAHHHPHFSASIVIVMTHDYIN